MKILLKKFLDAQRPEIQCIVFTENGSNDSENEIMELKKSFPSLNIHYTSTEVKGYGAGVKAAFHFIENSLGGVKDDQMVIMSAVDLPFGFSDLDSFVRENQNECEIFIGSKMHHESKINRTLKRFLATKVYFYCRYLLFQTKIKDSQGTFFVKGSVFKKMIRKVETNDFFFSTELALRSESEGYKIKEIPVIFFEDASTRVSKVSLIQDSLKMFRQLWLLKKKFLHTK